MTFLQFLRYKLHWVAIAFIAMWCFNAMGLLYLGGAVAATVLFVGVCYIEDAEHCIGCR